MIAFGLFPPLDLARSITTSVCLCKAHSEQRMKVHHLQEAEVCSIIGTCL